jgi:FkbM family methyltransferase
MNVFYLERLQKIWNHPANSGERIQALKRSADWWLKHRGAETPIEVNSFGYKALLYPDSNLTRNIIYYTQLYDFNDMQFVQQYLRPGDAFLDIGANIGHYTLLACSIVGQTGHVSAFEPVPQTVERLKENIAHNTLDQVKVYPMVVGLVDGNIDFTVVQDSVSHITASSDSPRSTKIQVPCRRLDGVVEDRPYAMAKIDVEGAELEVLKGASKLLSKQNPPVLMLEINGAHRRYGVETQDILNYLHEFGYVSALYEADGKKLSFTTEVWDNVFFINQDHIGQVLERIQSIERTA